MSNVTANINIPMRIKVLSLKLYNHVIVKALSKIINNNALK